MVSIASALCMLVFTVYIVNGKKVNELKFLTDYGYLASKNAFSPTTITAALKLMQRFAHLPETGVLDDATKKMMHTPRCGLPDNELDDNAFAYRKWTHYDLEYKFENYTPDLNVQETERIVREAFQLWSDVIPLNFQQANRTGDFSIVFGRYSHQGGYGGRGRCRARFDGRGGVLAHAYFPPDGRAHFDEDETYTDKTRQGTNLFWVAAHEFGHALGLSHSKVRGALMYPYYTGYKENFQLPNDDITRIQRLYGPRFTLGPGETWPPTTKPPTRPTLPGNCFDQRGEQYCKARISICRTSSDAWREFMKKYCYKTCYCDKIPETNAPSVTPSRPVEPETLLPTNPSRTTKRSGVTTMPPTQAPSMKPTTKSPVTKATGTVCVDKAGDYCKNHVKKCKSDDPVWKSYILRNCYKTCFC